MLAGLGEAHGYSIMQELKERIGGGWKPSPGAVYPAILALVETGYVEEVERDGARNYRLTHEGRRAAEKLTPSARWSALAARSEKDEERITVGSILDRYAAESKLRRRVAGTGERKHIDGILACTSREIEQALKKGEEGG